MPEPSPAAPPAAEQTVPRGDPVQQFWLLWRQGQRADVRQFLQEAGQLTPSQVAAVLLVDMREHWLIGERLPAEWYLSSYPTRQADLEFTVELIYGEFLLREELDEGPTLAEYLQRFPDYAPRLRQQFEFHQALEATPLPQARHTIPAQQESSQELGADGPLPFQAASHWPQVKGYEILSVLGRGGMGVVYRARQRDAKRLVALKMVLPGADAGSQALARFRTEIEAVARLQHPHIVPIYEVGEWRAGDVGLPMPYFSMEFTAGGSLAQKLSGTPLPFRRAAQLLETLARAIHYAHRAGHHPSRSYPFQHPADGRRDSQDYRFRLGQTDDA